MPISYKFRIEDETPAHVTVGVFAGKNPGSRGKCGSLTFTVEEWPEFQELLVRGGHALGAVVEFARLDPRDGGGWADVPLQSASDP